MAAITTSCGRGAIVERGAALHGMGVPSCGPAFLMDGKATSEFPGGLENSQSSGNKCISCWGYMNHGWREYRTLVRPPASGNREGVCVQGRLCTLESTLGWDLCHAGAFGSEYIS